MGGLVSSLCIASAQKPSVIFTRLCKLEIIGYLNGKIYITIHPTLKQIWIEYLLPRKIPFKTWSRHLNGSEKPKIKILHGRSTFNRLKSCDIPVFHSSALLYNLFHLYRQVFWQPHSRLEIAQWRCVGLICVMSPIQIWEFHENSKSYDFPKISDHKGFYF